MQIEMVECVGGGPLDGKIVPKHEYFLRYQQLKEDITKLLNDGHDTEVRPMKMIEYVYCYLDGKYQFHTASKNY